jgi:DNA primase
MLQFAADTAVLRLKWRNIQQMIRENMETMQQTQDTATIDQHLVIHGTLKKYEKEIAVQLGVVVAR